MKVNLQQDLHSPPHFPRPASTSSAGSGTSQCQTGSSCRSPRSGNSSDASSDHTWMTGMAEHL